MVRTVAADELEALLEALEDPAREGLEDAIKRVAATARRYENAVSSDYVPYMEKTAEIVGRMMGLDYAEERINALASVTMYFYFLGLTADALGPAAKAVELARRAGHRLLRKTLTFRGAICADTGNIPLSIECYAEALELARAQGDREGESTSLNNLGVALCYSGQFRDAIAVFERTIHLSEAYELADPFSKIAASNIALCCLSTGETERGLRAVEFALRDLPEPRQTIELLAKVLRETYYARLLLETGELKAAGEHVAIALRYAEPSGSHRARAVAAMAQGQYLVYAGHAKEGIALLTQTTEQCRRELPVMLRDLLGIQVKVYEFLEMPREALAHLQELLDWLRRWQYDGALQHVKLQLEPLDSEGGDSNFASRLRSREAQLRGKVAEQEMFRSPVEMLERLAVTAELREDSTGEHCYRLAKLAALLAREAGSDADTCERIERAARLHDIGKNAIPDTIILKRGKLTVAEREIVGSHAAVGADLIAGSGIPQMEMAEQVARHHHDWWDGSSGGKFRNEAIPYPARLCAIADVFDALTHDRPHRAAWSVREALAEIARLRGTQFDPRLADLFTEMIPRLRREHRDLDAFLGEAAKSSSFLQARSRIKHALQDTP